MPRTHRGKERFPGGIAQDVILKLFKIVNSTGEGPLSSGNRLKWILNILLLFLRKFELKIFEKLALIPKIISSYLSLLL